MIEDLIKTLIDKGSLREAVAALDAYFIKEETMRNIKPSNIAAYMLEDPEFTNVREFHVKFKQLVGDKPRHLTRRKMAERANFLLEELLEFADGSGLELVCSTYGFKFRVNDDTPDQDMGKQADALIDLVYVAKGTAVMMGLPWMELWDDVQRANMAKALGETARSRANPGQFLMDVGKPAGWEPPKTELILKIAGYCRPAFIDINTGFVCDDSCADDAIYNK